MVEWSSGSKSVQSSATTTSGRLPLTNGTQDANSFHTSTPVLEKNRSTCLTACFPLSSFATARARPSAPTASWAPCRAPTVASASEATRFAWRSQSKIEETKSCTRRGRMARVRMAQHDDLNPADRLQLRPSHDRGNEGIGQAVARNGDQREEEPADIPGALKWRRRRTPVADRAVSTVTRCRPTPDPSLLPASLSRAVIGRAASAGRRSARGEPHARPRSRRDAQRRAGVLPLVRAEAHATARLALPTLRNAGGVRSSHSQGATGPATRPRNRTGVPRRQQDRGGDHGAERWRPRDRPRQVPRE